MVDATSMLFRCFVLLEVFLGAEVSEVSRLTHSREAPPEGDKMDDEETLGEQTSGARRPGAKGRSQYFTPRELATHNQAHVRFLLGLLDERRGCDGLSDTLSCASSD